MLYERKTSNGGNTHHKIYRMARRANGLDLSEAFIIVDYIVIKNTSYILISLHASIHSGSGSHQDYRHPC